ncbi:MAG: HAMP domain-containing histidine kinase [Thiovulaceae bacterium]|nr:HAMP domain-containing histidine kinase [Sulfurimonadaceae bacterium]
MRQNNILIFNYFLILLILLGFIPITLYLFSSLPLILAITLITLLAIIISFWLVKTLLSPLLSISKKFDLLLKETLHELNIPVSTINANASMLKKHLDEPKKLRQCERIIEASEHLLQMHTSLEYTIKKEFHQPDKEPIDLDRFIEKRLDHYKSLYPHVTFITNLEPTKVKIDTHGLQKSIDNLVSNSVKYAKKDPQITLVLKQNILSIMDNGKGIDESQLLMIFERYYQEQTSSEGYGIGLSIVKSFCDQQNIKLSISSEPNIFTKVVLNFSKLKIEDS